MSVVRAIICVFLMMSILSGCAVNTSQQVTDGAVGANQQAANGIVGQPNQAARETGSDRLSRAIGASDPRRKPLSIRTIFTPLLADLQKGIQTVRARLNQAIGNPDSRFLPMQQTIIIGSIIAVSLLVVIVFSVVLV